MQLELWLIGWGDWGHVTPSPTQVFSELAYFQVAIKLLYYFQLIFERMSSLSS